MLLLFTHHVLHSCCSASHSDSTGTCCLFLLLFQQEPLRRRLSGLSKQKLYDFKRTTEGAIPNIVRSKFLFESEFFGDNYNSSLMGDLSFPTQDQQSSTTATSTLNISSNASYSGWQCAPYSLNTSMENRPQNQKLFSFL